MDGKALLTDLIASGKVSQAQIARDAKCSQGHLSLYLRGKRGMSVGLAKRVSQATGVPVKALVPEKIEQAEETLEAAQ